MLPLRWVFQQSLDELHKNGFLCIHLCIAALEDTVTVTGTISQHILNPLSGNSKRQATSNTILSYSCVSLWAHPFQMRLHAQNVCCFLIPAQLQNDLKVTERREGCPFSQTQSPLYALRSCYHHKHF